jgi:hypothetical protein
MKTLPFCCKAYSLAGRALEFTVTSDTSLRNAKLGEKVDQLSRLMSGLEAKRFIAIPPELNGGRTIERRFAALIMPSASGRAKRVGLLSAATQY